MNRRSFLKTSGAVGLATGLPSAAFAAAPQSTSNNSESHKQPHSQNPSTLLLKDYRPKSIYKIPVTQVAKAKFPVIDMHSHPYAKSPAQIAEWVRTMDEVGIEKTMILTMTTGAEFDKIYKDYAKHGDRFEIWCGLDFTGYKQPGFAASVVKELKRCVRTGARGVGEIHDKGEGLHSGKSKALGMHPDDARMDALFEACAELGLPFSLHVADPVWMYQKMDRTNDGLMNAYNWRLDNKPDIVGLAGMVEILERTAARHPHTIFIACHLVNLDYDLTRLEELLNRCPNVHADISARYAETAATPRAAAQFYAKYADRLVYGTDMGVDKPMYIVTFRILETLDEHFYEIEQFDYHWYLNGFGLPDEVLRKVYHENAAKLLAGRS